MSLLTVMPVYSGDAPMAETLLDWILQIAKRKKGDSALIVCYADTHEEMRMKLFLAAEAAYSNFDLIVAPEISSMSKADRVGAVFNFAADHVSKNYRLPWLWLEPDSVPLKTGWLDELDAAYHAQGKRHFGPHFQTAERKIFMSKTAIFSSDLGMAKLPQSGGEDKITPASSKTRLIQQVSYKKPEEVRADACLLHSDKSGMLIRHLREKL